MISIIVSKYHPTQIDVLKRNIEETIRVPYELIVIENGKGEMGLCAVYNKGAQMAKYELLCYAHEDIEIESVGWGGTVIQIFQQNPNLGLLGLAGSAFKPHSPSGWWHPHANPETVVSNYVQGSRNRNLSSLQYHNPGNHKLSPVACVDGFWFCTRREFALELKFDEQTFKGFHCYDIDFSLNVFRYYDVAVTFEIIIKHFSEGSGFKEWVNDTLKLYDKWENAAPFDAMHLDARHRRAEETKAFDYFLRVMLENGYSMKQVFQLLWSIKAKSLLGLKGFFHVNLDIGWVGFKRMVKHALQVS